MNVNTLKNLFFVILSGFLGLMVNPESLMASDLVAVSGLDSTRIVETVIIEPTVEEEMTEESTIEGVTDVKNSTPVVSAPRAGVVEKTVPADNIAFSWGTQGIFRVSSTAANSGTNAARVGRLIWGHNYTAFGNIVRLGIGSTFTITEGGATTTYQVAANPLDGKAGVALDVKDDSTLSYASNPKYNSIKMNAFTDMGFGEHSLVLMTCYGANSRYIVVADAI
ncbi:hypothetical protein J6X73_00425 [Candidatus Saccharibacteria bacterium]|nr:hypothetical protein [Candidatus Saccharibacteria bacterium]